MNIKVTHRWLLEYLETDASPHEIQKYLSLCGPSIERVEKINDDYIYDIEVTSNRVDMASVFGIAQEAVAILPQFKKKAKLKLNPLKSYIFSSIKTTGESKNLLDIKILARNLCSRFTAIILDNVKIQPSPELMQERLTLCGVKSINNVVDISNYLMLSLGQPVHIFDYDQIGKATMLVRESLPAGRQGLKGEKIVTLDGKQITLPGDDIVIEDGNKRLIDLCGIMGGFNSAVNAKTSKIILFVQTYNPQKIRRTSMTTGQRTVAATYFEKGLDEERVEPTAVYGVELLMEFAHVRIASQIYDIYPNRYKAKRVSLLIEDVKRLIGIHFSKDKIVEILTSLGFKYHIGIDQAKMVFEVPSYRSRDVSIKEDLIEEIARIYGYHNLPNKIQPTVYIKQPKEIGLLFELQSKVKHFLKHLGLNEVMNYSMISKQMIANSELKIEDHLAIKNSISEEIKYMRVHISSSLIMNIKNNEGKTEVLRLFEIAKTYKKRPNDLPEESYRLGIVTNTSLSDLKGIVDSLLRELNTTSFSIKKSNNDFLQKNLQGEIFVGKEWLAKYGELSSKHKMNYQIKNKVFLAFFNFNSLIKNYKPLPHFHPINPFAVIKLDLTVESHAKKTFEDMKKSSFEISKLLQKIELLGAFKNKITLRFYFSSNSRNITEDEAKKQLENIKESVMDST